MSKMGVNERKWAQNGIYEVGNKIGNKVSKKSGHNAAQDTDQMGSLYFYTASHATRSRASFVWN